MPSTSRPQQGTSLLYILIALGAVNITLTTPSFPALTDYLSSSAQNVQFSLTFYLVGFGLSQLFYGPYSDSHGRKPAIIIGLSLFLIGTMVCLLAESIYGLWLGRLIQGLGCGCTNTLSYATFRDCYQNESLAVRYNLLSLCSASAAITAPLVGSYFQYYGYWQLSFEFMLLVGMFLWLGIHLRLVETNPPTHKISLKESFTSLPQRYWGFLKNRQFMGYGLCACCIFTLPPILHAMLPFIFIETLHVPTDIYGWLAISTGITYIMAVVMGVRLCRKYGINNLIYIGNLFLLAGAAIGLLLAAIGELSVISVLIPILIAFFGAGLVFPNAVTGAINGFAHCAGTASALAGFLLSLTAIIGTGLASLFADNNAIPLMFLFCAFGSCSCLVAWRLIPNQIIHHTRCLDPNA